MENVPYVANTRPFADQVPGKIAKTHGAGKRPKSTLSVVNGRRVDIVTGQKLVSVYFDPQQSPEVLAEATDADWVGKHLYSPAAIIKEDAESGVLSVRLPSGDVYKMASANVSKVSDQDEEGVEDILQLKEFSEMSLIHTLRVRYSRDEIYTFVGPILISINPYKWLKDMYSEQSMIDYHNHKKVRLTPRRRHHSAHHLF